MSKSRYSILIICEGENTEPLFFNSIKDEIYKKTIDIDAAIKILPEPKVISNNDVNPQASIHKKERKRRSLRKAISVEPEILDGEPPLRWVRTGRRELNEGTFDEVWVVFDRDNHPSRKEAFEEANQIINGKQVEIAFSSRSFEYYLLLHFERIYKKFIKTECKIGDSSIDCGTGSHANDCKGEICINGYARSKGYWTDSKGNISVYQLVKDKLEFGFENSAWLRFISYAIDRKEPDYDRNPYITVDRLIKRLTGYESYSWEYISNTGNNKGLKISKDQNYLIHIENTSKNTIIIPQDSFYRIHLFDRQKTYFGERKVLPPSEEYTVPIEKNTDPEIKEYFGFQFERNITLFDFSEDNHKLKLLIEYLVHLTHKELETLIKGLSKIIKD